ncbi:MAG: hypothetical protein PHY47_00500 [Lachnospiraceae bacterium]|nr:hypothetical protein [Lachnospiraceae bacterium]
MSKKINKEAFKSPEEIDKMISEIETSAGGEPSAPFSPIPMPTGNLVGEEYYRGKLFPQIQNYLPEGMELNREEQIQLVRGVQRKLTGLSASVPIKCYGDKCPFARECPLHKIGKAPIGQSCHIPGELIKTVHHGEIKIEDLDESIHSLTSYERRRDAIHFAPESHKSGRKFRRVSREYHGNIIEIKTAREKKNSITSEHISIARFNENAIDKFCVYLMRKGDFFRIGKSQILKKTNNKYRIPLQQRLKSEEGDALWVLGIYNTNSEALLSEEFFSCYLQAPKALFIPTNSSRIKTEGLYKWVTQEELDLHHSRFLRPTCYWAGKLEELGLSLDYPFIDKDNSDQTYEDIKVYAHRSMFIRACNLLPEIMDVPVFPEKGEKNFSENERYTLVNWEKIESLNIGRYKGLVYSLDVEGEKTYFANNVATHNCPLEAMVLDTYTKRYIEEFEVEPDNFSEVITMTQLAACHIMEMRGWIAIGKDDDSESPDGIIKNVVGYTADEDPITQYQEHPGYLIIERAWRWRSKLLESLGATRKDKLKFNNGDEESIVRSLSESNASLRSKIDKLTTIDIQVD